MRKFRKPTLGSIVALLLMLLGLGLMLGTIWQQEKNILEGEKAAQLKIRAIEKAITDFKQSPAALKPPRQAKF